MSAFWIYWILLCQHLKAAQGYYWDVRRVLQCEKEKIRLNCSGAKDHINIISVYYGNVGYSQCNGNVERKDDCGVVENSLKRVEKLCARKKTCVVSSSSAAFGNPGCYLTKPGLRIDYSCEPNYAAEEDKRKCAVTVRVLYALSKRANKVSRFGKTWHKIVGNYHAINKQYNWGTAVFEDKRKVYRNYNNFSFIYYMRGHWWIGDKVGAPGFLFVRTKARYPYFANALWRRRTAWRRYPPANRLAVAKCMKCCKHVKITKRTSRRTHISATLTDTSMLYQGKPVYKKDDEPQIRLYYWNEHWALGEFDRRKNHPDLKTPSNAECPEEILSDWSVYDVNSTTFATVGAVNIYCHPRDVPDGVWPFTALNSHQDRSGNRNNAVISKISFKTQRRGSIGIAKFGKESRIFLPNNGNIDVRLSFSVCFFISINKVSTATLFGYLGPHKRYGLRIFVDESKTDLSVMLHAHHSTVMVKGAIPLNRLAMITVTFETQSGIMKVYQNDKLYQVIRTPLRNTILETTYPLRIGADGDTSSGLHGSFFCLQVFHSSISIITVRNTILKCRSYTAVPMTLQYQPAIDFIFFPQKVSHGRAIHLCRKYKSILASVATKEENAYLIGYIDQFNTWIGSIDESSPDNPSWSNGCPVSWTHWKTGFPIQKCQTSNCVMRIGGSGLWKEVDCKASKFSVLCRKQISLCSVPALGAWQPWSGWSKCSVTCGQGYVMKERSCVCNQADNINGCECNSMQFETRKKSCSLAKCKKKNPMEVCQHSSPTEEPETFSDGGNKKLCVFPFIYKGVTYNDCINTGSKRGLWCGTECNTDDKANADSWTKCLRFRHEVPRADHECVDNKTPTSFVGIGYSVLDADPLADTNPAFKLTRRILWIDDSYSQVICRVIRLKSAEGKAGSITTISEMSNYMQTNSAIKVGISTVMIPAQVSLSRTNSVKDMLTKVENGKTSYRGEMKRATTGIVRIKWSMYKEGEQGFFIAQNFQEAACRLTPRLDNIEEYYKFLKTWGIFVVVKTKLGWSLSSLKEKKYSGKNEKSSHQDATVWRVGVQLGPIPILDLPIPEKSGAPVLKVGDKESSLDPSTVTRHGSEDDPYPQKIELKPLYEVFRFKRSAWTVASNECINKLSRMAEIMQTASSNLPAAEGMLKQISLERRIMSSGEQWPGIPFAMVAVSSGCPTPSCGTKVLWHKGWRLHGVDSNTMSLNKNVDMSRGTLRFCVLQHIKENQRGAWPTGNYCIFRASSTCPAGMGSGALHSQNEKPIAANGGHLPTGEYTDKLTVYQICCMEGDQDVISLPKTVVFSLIKMTRDCPIVREMRVQVVTLWLTFGSIFYKKNLSTKPFGIRTLQSFTGLTLCFYYPLAIP